PVQDPALAAARRAGAEGAVPDAADARARVHKRSDGGRAMGGTAAAAGARGGRARADRGARCDLRRRDDRDPRAGAARGAGAAPPLGWVVQLVGGWLLDEAACGRGSHDWGIDDHLWQGVLSGAAIVVAAAGLAAAWSSWQAVHAGAADARGRADFLATAALSA